MWLIHNKHLEPTKVLLAYHRMRHLFVAVVLVIFQFSSVLLNTAHALPSTAAAVNNNDLSTLPIQDDDILREAARNGSISVVIGMISGGVHVDDTDAQGWTALMWASRNGHEDIVDYLLEHGANEEHQSNTGDFSLLWAAYGGFVSIVTTFLAMDVNPDMTEEKGITALMAATIAGSTDVVQLLLDAGADSTITDQYGVNALTYAARTGQDEIIILLSSYEDVTSMDNLGWTALHHAVSLNTSSGAESLVQLLSTCPDLGITAIIGPNNWTATEFAIGINNDFAISAFQEHLGKLSTCILDLEEYTFSEAVYFDCRQFECHCYGHWVPIDGTDPDCRKITLEVLATQDLNNNAKLPSLPDI